MSIYAAMSQFVCDCEVNDTERLHISAKKAATQNGVRLAVFEMISRIGLKGGAIDMVRVEFTDDYGSSVSSTFKV